MIGTLAFLTLYCYEIPFYPNHCLVFIVLVYIYTDYNILATDMCLGNL